TGGRPRPRYRSRPGAGAAAKGPRGANGGEATWRSPPVAQASGRSIAHTRIIIHCPFQRYYATLGLVVHPANSEMIVVGALPHPGPLPLGEGVDAATRESAAELGGCSTKGCIRQILR